VKSIQLRAFVLVLAVTMTYGGNRRVESSQSAVPDLSRPDAGTRSRIAEAYGRQPLGFEANRGQTGAAPQDVQFLSRGAGYTLFLTSTEAVMRLRNARHELRMKLVDSNPAPRVTQENELPGKSHYIIGSDRRAWHTHIPRYGKVRYQAVYPGVDLVYYGNQQQLEYDFIVAPGADPQVIELAFEGAENIRVDTGGDLLALTGEGELRLKAPVIYQDIDGRRVETPGGYRKTGSDRVAFDLGAYDSTRPLVVDPIVVFSSYLGGSSHDLALGIAVDADGIPYITGYTASVDFPTSGARQPGCATNGGVCEDAFITKLGSYSTYFGGTSGDLATAIAVRSDTREAYVTGWTRSPDFPTANAIDAVFGDDLSRERAFVTRLTSDGSDLVYSTYLAGDDPWAHPNAIALDADGAAYVTGSESAAQGGPDVFVTKLTADGSAVAYSNRFGGGRNDVAYGIAVDDQGYASVTGATDSLDFPRFGPFHPASGGFAAKLLPDGSAFVYSTYLPGAGTGLALVGPYTYVAGVMPGRQYFSASPGGPGGGSTDAFVQVLDFGGQLRNVTHLGGTGDDRGSAIGIDRAGNVWVTGVTTSTDFPLVNPLQGQMRDLDAFVVRFDSGLQPIFSTYFGGSGREQLMSEIGSSAFPGPPGPALAVGVAPFGDASPGGVAWVAGFTDSTDFPTGGLLPAPQPTSDGSLNSFVAAFVDDGVPTKPNLAVTNHPDFPAELEFGRALPYVFEVTNKGPARATDVWFVDKLPADVRVDQVFVVTPGNPNLQTCNHDDRWVACRVAFTLSQSESVFVVITATPTTVGPQINTAAVLSQGESSHAFAFWISGFNQDLVWGEDAARDGDIHDNSVITTTVMTPAPEVNRPPTANAGPDQIVSAGATCRTTVTLNGTGSSDPDGDSLTYTWTIENLLPPPILNAGTDPASGAVTGPAPSGELPVGTHTITLTVDDGHGGTASDTVVVAVRDTTAPIFSGVPAPVTLEQSSPSGTAFNVALPAAADNCSSSVVVSSNAPAVFPPGPTVVTFTARDAAGNDATAATTATVVDTIAPALTMASPEPRTYLHSDVLTMSFAAADSGSGLAAGMPAASLDGSAVASGQSISLLILALGTHSFALTAGDLAGNSRSQTVTFSVVATVDSLIASVGIFGSQAGIDESSVRSLLAKLKDAKEASERGKPTTTINKLQEFIDAVQAQSGRHITLDAAQVLVADAQYVIGTLR
jgi:uncharacterized repeat protein (TIGR01451 family)